MVEETKVHLQPRILIATNDHAWVVGVEKEDTRVRMGILQQEMLCRQVQVGVVAARGVDLDAAGGVGALRVPGSGGEGSCALLAYETEL